MALANSIVNDKDYPMLKLTLLEKGYAMGMSEKSDAVRLGIFKSFEMMEVMAESHRIIVNEEKEVPDPDLYPEIPEE